MNRRILLGLALALLGVSSNLWAKDWAHWRGPTGNGVAPDATPPIKWSGTENVKWKVEVPGRSSASPIIWKDRVYVVSAVPVESASSRESEPVPTRQEGRNRGRRRRGETAGELEFKIFCLDRSNGDLVWEQTAVVATPHEGTHSTNGFASASPCTDGENLYVHFGSRGIYCYTLDGEPKWKRDDLGEMRIRNNFGEGSSPTVVDGRVIIPWDHEGDSFLLALDAKSGETIWKVDRDEPSCWATPLVVEHNGQKQIIMNGDNYARSYDFESGKELWRCAGQSTRPVASPVYEDGIVFVGSGFQGSFLGAFRLNGEGDIEGTDQVKWTVGRGTPDIPSLLLVSGRLYFFKGKTGIFSCLDAETGEPHYGQTRVPGLRSVYASPIAAGGYIFLTGRNGSTVVIEDSDEFKIVATNSVGETVDATPAPVGNELFIRGEKHLFCIGE